MKKRKPILLLSCSMPLLFAYGCSSRVVDFQSITTFPQTFEGLTFELLPLVFTNPKAGGTPLPITLEDRVEDKDGKPELNIGYSNDEGTYEPLFVDFPEASFPSGVKFAFVELRHFHSAEILALDNIGKVIATAAQQDQDMRVTLALGGNGIRRLQFTTIETLVYKISWKP